jgi:hypothetical protein
MREGAGAESGRIAAARSLEAVRVVIRPADQQPQAVSRALNSSAVNLYSCVP